MATTNQIIIPVVGSRCSIQPSNSLPSSFTQLTPTKPNSAIQTLPWKKTSSAFKKFKDKKDKKNQNPLP